MTGLILPKLTWSYEVPDVPPAGACLFGRAHEPVDTGMKKAWCKVCDVNMELTEAGHWETRHVPS